MLTAGLKGVTRGVVAAIGEQGEPLVDFPGNNESGHISAQSTVSISVEDVGKEAVLVFEDDDPARPIILGLIVPPRKKKPVHALLDGEKLVLKASQEIVLECGEASITLTKAGKVLIRGTYLLSRSTGPNRIKGGSVQLN